MINVPEARAAMAAVTGDRVAYSKAQMSRLLDEVERGQRALREATNLRAAVSAALSSSGAPA